MREKARRGEVTFGLTADVKEAHRQVPIHPDDWHVLGCKLDEGGEVFVNTVGTFGVSSASYYWSRISAAVCHPVRSPWLPTFLEQDYRRNSDQLGRS